MSPEKSIEEDLSESFLEQRVFGLEEQKMLLNSFHFDVFTWNIHAETFEIIWIKLLIKILIKLIQEFHLDGRIWYPGA